MVRNSPHPPTKVVHQMIRLHCFAATRPKLCCRMHGLCAWKACVWRLWRMSSGRKGERYGERWRSHRSSTQHQFETRLLSRRPIAALCQPGVASVCLILFVVSLLIILSFNIWSDVSAGHSLIYILLIMHFHTHMKLLSSGSRIRFRLFHSENMKFHVFRIWVIDN